MLRNVAFCAGDFLVGFFLWFLFFLAQGEWIRTDSSSCFVSLSVVVLLKWRSFSLSVIMPMVAPYKYSDTSYKQR